MTVALTVYRIATAGLSPLVPQLLNARVAKGKEIADRQSERLARHLPTRPRGEVIWLHGASVGETRLLIEVADALRKLRPDAFLLFTSQTRTSAELVADLLPEHSQHQLAPVDTPSATRRFIAHWEPDLCIFAEGEIWPNLLLAAQSSHAKLALINARMTEKSITGWSRIKRTAQRLFSRFDLILAADTRTAAGLSQLTGQDVPAFGNLKTVRESARPADGPARVAFAWDGPVLLGASTHPGEEVLLLDSLAQMAAGSRLILAQRHPERGDDIDALLTARGVRSARWSRGEVPQQDTEVLLADTIGDMHQWYDMADWVYLGGAHVPDIGGHNPLEPLGFGKPVLTGPHTTNFADMIEDLKPLGAITIVKTAKDIAAACTDANATDTDAINAYFATGRKRLQEAAARLVDLLVPEAAE
ncbi:MAG: glycosyltransferase N-terminal domain-containing protein [Pseudomonadota bacterium]